MPQALAPFHKTTIREGLPGVDDTLKMMRRLILAGKVHPLVRQFAVRLVHDLPQMAYGAEAKRIHQFVRDQIRYVQDPHNVEMLHAPEYILANGYGDCDDKTIIFCSLMESIGHPCKIVAVGNMPGICSHVYAETKIGNRWLTAECCPVNGELWGLGRPPVNIRCRRTLLV